MRRANRRENRVFGVKSKLGASLTKFAETSHNGLNENVRQLGLKSLTTNKFLKRRLKTSIKSVALQNNTFPSRRHEIFV